MIRRPHGDVQVLEVKILAEHAHRIAQVAHDLGMTAEAFIERSAIETANALRAKMSGNLMLSGGLYVPRRDPNPALSSQSVDMSPHRPRKMEQQRRDPPPPPKPKKKKRRREGWGGKKGGQR
jgi:hypothetical protein